ncbi:IS110 family transposase [Paralysiella testudinis]|uniref:Transposase n=2 Tax=Paralysiella testudinis TaxID=2809020 RepID=A0A892ZFS8_9NEIS|nr:transposase [Paralysiella testudinis]QRQ82295.1 transposase [Paralysiella testudinis]
MMNFQVLGIDISKNKLDCALIRDIGSSKIKTKALPNHLQGFNQLTEWLYKNIGEDLSLLKIFMEATGVYHEALAEYLHNKGIAVYLLNPADSAHYAKYDSLHKTDKADSQSLARAGIDRLMHHKVRQWQPAAPHIKRLNALLARLDALQSDPQREDNRMEKAGFSAVPEAVSQSISTMQTNLKQQIGTITQEIEQHIDRHPDLKKTVLYCAAYPV